MSQNAIPIESGFNSESRVFRKWKYFFGVGPLQIFKMILIFLMFYWRKIKIKFGQTGRQNDRFCYYIGSDFTWSCWRCSCICYFLWLFYNHLRYIMHRFWLVYVPFHLLTYCERQMKVNTACLCFKGKRNQKHGFRKKNNK